MKYLFILLLIFSKQILGTTSHYQKIDSLKKLLVKNKVDTNSIDLKNQISMVYFRLQNNDSSLLFTKEAINDSKKINYKKGLVSANLNMASISTRQGLYPNALKYCFEAQNILGINGDKKLLAKSNLKIGLIYYYEEKYKEALKYFQIAFKQSEMSADINGQAEALGNMAIINRILGDYNKSLLYYKQTLNKFNELLTIAKKENNKSDVIKSKFGISNCIGNIGFLLESQNKFDEAIAKYNEAIEIENEINSEENAAIHHNNLANVYLKKKNFDEAKSQLVSVYKFASKTNAPDLLRDYYFSLSQLDSALGNYNMAFVHRKLFFAYRDSLINTENLEKTVQAQMQFEFDKKEAISKSEQDKKNAIAKKESERQKAVRNSFILGFILVLIIAITVYRNLKRNQKAKEIIEQQKLILEIKNKEILDSIHYAKRIQFTLLASESILQNNLNKHFILFQPKDIVSGDFYWAATKDDYFYLAVCDSHRTWSTWCIDERVKYNFLE